MSCSNLRWLNSNIDDNYDSEEEDAMDESHHKTAQDSFDNDDDDEMDSELMQANSDDDDEPDW